MNKNYDKNNIYNSKKKQEEENDEEKNEKKVTFLRPLGAAELVYEHEYANYGGMTLPVTLRFSSSSFNLLQHLAIVEQSIQEWKNAHPLLRARIVPKRQTRTHDGEHDDEKEEEIPELWFALASQEKQTGYFDNVCLLRSKQQQKKKKVVINIETKTTEKEEEEEEEEEVLRCMWETIHENELNSAKTFDSVDGLLWRLTLAELLTTFSSPSRYEYSVTFTSHHALVDSINVFALLDQLISIIGKNTTVQMQLSNNSNNNNNNNNIKNVNNNGSSSSFGFFSLDQVCPSIEQKLSSMLGGDENDDGWRVDDFKENPAFQAKRAGCKIPDSFGQKYEEFTMVRRLKDSFVDAFPTKEENNININNRGIQNNALEVTTKITSFTLDCAKTSSLLAECRKRQAKLTGCLNLLATLAHWQVHETLNEPTDEISFHLLANLRPLCRVGNLNMGYWAVVLQGLFKREDHLHSDLLKILKDDNDGKFVENFMKKIWTKIVCYLMYFN